MDVKLWKSRAAATRSVLSMRHGRPLFAPTGVRFDTVAVNGWRYVHCRKVHGDLSGPKTSGEKAEGGVDSLALRRADGGKQGVWRLPRICGEPGGALYLKEEVPGWVSLPLLSQSRVLSARLSHDIE